MRIAKLSNPSRQGLIAVYAKPSPGEHTGGGPSGPSRKSQKVATLDANAIADLGLAIGVEWTPSLAKRALAMGNLALAKRDAYRAVGQRMMSAQRLVDRLKRKGHDPAVARSVADDLVVRGLLNDEHYAALVASATASAKRGKRAIEAKLRQRGIGQSTARAAASTAAGERDALADATDLARARAKRMPAKLDANARRRRLLALLMRRGHDYDVAERAVRAVLRDRDDVAEH